MAISEYGVNLNERGAGALNWTRWFQRFFAFVDEVNQPGNPGMAYVTWWDDDQANVGKFSVRVPEPHNSTVRNMFRARVPGSPPGVTPPPVEPPSPEPPPPPPPSFEPTQITHGAGADTLVLKISQQPLDNVSATYRVMIDNAQYGPVFTASARRAASVSDTLTLKGDWASGPHAVQVWFLNNEWGGSLDRDRNLHLDGASFNGAPIPNTRQDINGGEWPGEFQFTKSGTAPPPEPPPPGADWEAEAKRLQTENAALSTQVTKLKANAASAIAALNAPAA
jgi:hypothetical protein